MPIKLFVDDIRRCPDGWVPARTVTEAIRLLATQNVEEVSLDHDITCAALAKMGQHAPHRYHSSEETFEPVARFIAVANECRSSYHGEQCGSPCDCPPELKIRIHTGNYEMGRKLAGIMGVPYTPKDFDEKDYA